MDRLNKFEESSHEKGYGQFAISAGLRIAAKLEKGMHNKYSDSHEVRPEHIDLHPLHMLNWFALFFAQSDGESTAVAVTKNQNEIHVNISINSGKAQDIIKHRASAFLNCIYDRIVPNVGVQHPGNAPKGDYDALIAVLVKNCSPMIQHRLKALKMAIDHAGGVESVMTHWQSIGHHALSATGSDVKANVHRHLTSLHSMLPNISEPAENTEAKHIQLLKSVLLACHALVELQFVPDQDDANWHSDLAYDVYQTLDNLYRQFRSIYSYHSETAEFSHSGIAYMQQLVGVEALRTKVTFEKHVKVVWVCDRASLTSHCTWELPPRQWLSDFLHDYEAGNGSICRPENDAHKEKLMTHCASFWTQGEAISALIHPEIELLYFLKGKGINTDYYTIGTDSELCFVCGQFFEQVTKIGGEYWLTNSWSPNKIQEDWLLPPMAKVEGVADYSWAELPAKVTGLLVRVRAARAIEGCLKEHRTTPQAKANVKEIREGPAIDVKYSSIRSLPDKTPERGSQKK